MHRNRISFVALLFVLGFLMLATRLVWLQGFEWEKYEQLSALNRQRIALYAAPRGRILARGGEILALDTPTHELHYSLLEVEKTRLIAQRLARFFRLRGRTLNIPTDEDAICESLERLRALYRDSFAMQRNIPPHPWIQGLDPDLALQLKQVVERRPDNYPGISAECTAQGGVVYVAPELLFAGEVGTRRVEQILGLKAGELYLGEDGITARYQEARNPKQSLTERRRNLEQDRVLLREVPFEAVRQIACAPARFPGLHVVENQKRLYPAGSLLCHLIGYVTSQRFLAPGKKLAANPAEEPAAEEREPSGWEVNRDLRRAFVSACRTSLTVAEAESLSSEFCLEDDAVGMAGLEKSRNSSLRGRTGARLTDVMRPGELVGKVRFCLPPMPGQDIQLTVDIPLCEQIRREFQEEGFAAGAALVGDPKSGEILAYVSLPDYDLNTFRQSKDAYKLLHDDPHKPLRDRPRSWLPPGSTIKPVLALHALDRGVIQPGTPYTCSGAYDPRFPDQHRCRNHSIPMTLTIEGALARSCNCFFNHVGAKLLGIDGMREALTRFEIGPEFEGLKYDMFPNGTREALSAAIGQGSLLASPWQIYRFMSLLALRGDYPEPHFVREVDPTENRVHPTVSSASIETVVRGLKESARIGTASSSAIGLCRYSCAVKTGTADTDVKSKTKNAAWIAGFAPADDPQVVFVIVIEETSLHGGDAAGPLAVSILEFLESQRGMNLRRH